MGWGGGMWVKFFASSFNTFCLKSYETNFLRLLLKLSMKLITLLTNLLSEKLFDDFSQKLASKVTTLYSPRFVVRTFFYIFFKTYHKTHQTFHHASKLKENKIFFSHSFRQNQIRKLQKTISVLFPSRQQGLTHSSRCLSQDSIT